VGSVRDGLSTQESVLKKNFLKYIGGGKNRVGKAAIPGAGYTSKCVLGRGGERTANLSAKYEDQSMDENHPFSNNARC